VLGGEEGGAVIAGGVSGGWFGGTEGVECRWVCERCGCCECVEDVFDQL
jgi:hypothetical protein